MSVGERCRARKSEARRSGVRGSAMRHPLSHREDCQIKYKLLLIPPRSPMLCGERSDRNQPAKLPALPYVEYPAFPAPVGARLSLRFRGRPAVALRSVRGAILRATDAVPHILLRALRNLRQPGIAAHLRRVRSRRDRVSRANPGASRVALRALPSQIFLDKATAPRRAQHRSRA